VASIRNYRRTKDEISIALMISLIGIVMCSTLHEGEHWRHMWLFFGLVWGFNTSNFGLGTRPDRADRNRADRPSPQRLVRTAVRSRVGAPADARR